MDDTEVVNFLLQTEIIPLCLRIMETGSELSKTVATDGLHVEKVAIHLAATTERKHIVPELLIARAHNELYAALVSEHPLAVGGTAHNGQDRT